MAMALWVALENKKTVEEANASHSGLEQKIRRLCGLFVFIKDTKIYLIHQTAREFLVTKLNRPTGCKWYLEQNETEVEMTRICVSYLLMNDLVHGTTQDLLKYSAAHWISHFKCAEIQTDEHLRLAANLCETGKIASWVMSSEGRFYVYSHEPQAFFWVARWGLVDVASFILKHSNIEITDDIIESAASHASAEGVVMRLLLDQKGEEVKITQKVLQKAAANTYGGFPIMKLLLDRRGDNISISNEVMEAAAANNQHGLLIVKLLLGRKRGEIRITNKAMVSALKNWKGLEMTKYLLEQKGAKIRITRRIIRAALRLMPPERLPMIYLLYPKSPLIRYCMRQSHVYPQGRKSDAWKWDRVVGKRKPRAGQNLRIPIVSKEIQASRRKAKRGINRH